MGQQNLPFNRSMYETESEVMEKLLSYAIDQKSEDLEIPQLHIQTCGRFELLQCRRWFFFLGGGSSIKLCKTNLVFENL